LLDALNINVVRAHNDKDVRAIVITSAIPKFFVAGADISEIQSRQGSDDNS
jgi:enoyl-CoA hydratase/carnithine racemase